MHRWKFSTLAAVACFSAALTTDVAALTLGALSVQSARGQPLRAEINISQVTTAEMESLQAQIASPNVFRAHGMDYSAVARAIQVRLHRRADGSAALRLTSTAPIDSAFVDLVIDSNWSSGSLVRSYTLLLDPPASQRPVPAVTAAAQAGRSYTSQPPAQSRTPRDNTPSATQTAASNTTNRATATGPAIAVRSGDTAGRIAGARRPNGVSLDQMLVAMLRANPEAFIGGNINRVKAGAVLKMPDREAALSTSVAEAREIVAAQSRDFNAFRRGMATRAPQAQVAAADRTSTGRVQTQVNDASPAATPADKLTLSKGAVQSTAQTETQLAKQKQTEEQENRKQELQRNLAELQKLADKNPAQQSPPAPASTPAQPAAPASSDSASQPSDAVGGVDAVNPEPPASEAPDLATQDAQQTAPATDVASDTSSEPDKPQAHEEPPGMENLALTVGGGALALLLGLLGYLGWTRYRDANATKKNILQPASATAKTDSAKDAAAQTEQTAAETTVDLAVVDSAADPIAAADAYLSYGRDGQAEEVLKEALRNQPENLPVHAKLAEIFAKRHDLQQLEASARAIQTISQGEGAEWQRVRELGHNMDPDNPLYADLSAAMEASVASFSSSFADALSAASSEPDTTARKEPELDLHLDLDSEPPEPVDAPPVSRGSAQPQASDTQGIDLDLPSTPSATRVQGNVSPAATVDDGLNFELDGIASSASTTHTNTSVSTASSSLDKDNGDLNFDLGALNMDTDAATVDDASGPLATKLDLAQEFHAIGDSEGARSLIEEVLAEASGPLKARAQKMLSAIS